MGFYINPPNCSKEDFLVKHGTFLGAAPATHREGDNIAVCLVDNGGFTAAGIAIDQRERNDFAREDGRAKVWFHVPLPLLTPFLHGQPIAPASAEVE